jgi:hypothetical protein
MCENTQATAEYNWRQDDAFSWNQIRDINNEPKAPQQRWPHTKIKAAEAPRKADDGPFHIVVSFFQPIVSAFNWYSSAPELKTSFNDTHLPLHGN